MALYLWEDLREEEIAPISKIKNLINGPNCDFALNVAGIFTKSVVNIEKRAYL